MLSNLANVLGVTAFKLLAPSDNENSQRDLAAISNLLNILRQNIQDDINKRFNSLTG